MAMDFWAAKRSRKRRTALFLTVFFLLAVGVSFLLEISLRYFATEGYSPPVPFAGVYLFIFICLVSFFYYLSYAGFGGDLVAQSMGGWQVDPNDCSAKEAQLLNIVHEIAIASRLPIPKVYVIEAKEINAFAAGLKPEKSTIAVTTGALDALNREELQGVIAHEFGHIASGDMKIGMRLAALLMGFFLVFYIGLRLLEGSFFIRGGNSERRGNSAALIALALLLAGVILWFAGSILRACVNREREYMADASSVEFTRNPNGIASALRKIANEQARDMPKSGLGYSHLYFSNQTFWSRLFATHPPLEKRIAAIEGRKFK